MPKGGTNPYQKRWKLKLPKDTDFVQDMVIRNITEIPDIVNWFHTKVSSHAEVEKEDAEKKSNVLLLLCL